MLLDPNEVPTFGVGTSVHICLGAYQNWGPGSFFRRFCVPPSCLFPAAVAGRSGAVTTSATAWQRQPLELLRAPTTAAITRWTCSAEGNLAATCEVAVMSKYLGHDKYK